MREGGAGVGIVRGSAGENVITFGITGSSVVLILIVVVVEIIGGR